MNATKLKQHRMALKLLREDILDMYRNMAKQLYINHKNINQDTIRLEVMKVISAHVCDKSIERLNRKVRSGKTKVICVNETLKAKELSW
jgi:hypothetical protein